MKSRLKTGFTLIELMVVVVIIAILGGILIPAVFGALDKEKVLGTQVTIKDLGDALLAYKDVAKSFPDDFDDGTLQQAPVVGPAKAGYLHDRGYFHVLQNYSTFIYKKGTRVDNEQPFFSTDELFRFPAGSPYKAIDGTYDDNFIRDNWENPIQYRRMPTTFADFKRRFVGTATRPEYLKFISEQKPFHIWSYGPIGMIEDPDSQKYQGSLSPGNIDFGTNPDYHSGGYSGDDDDIGNW